jgi:hypothetical protein
MLACTHCEGPIEESFRYCPWCAAPQRLKLVEFFFPRTAIEADRGKALRVSRYFGEHEDEGHVRFSVWNETGEAEAALSLDEEEATRLARFVAGTTGPPSGKPRTLSAVLQHLRLAARR